MGRILSDIFDWFLDSTSLVWPVKLLISILVGTVLYAAFGSY